MPCEEQSTCIFYFTHLQLIKMFISFRKVKTFSEEVLLHNFINKLVLICFSVTSIKSEQYSKPHYNVRNSLHGTHMGASSRVSASWFFKFQGEQSEILFLNFSYPPSVYIYGTLSSYMEQVSWLVLGF